MSGNRNEMAVPGTSKCDQSTDGSNGDSLLGGRRQNVPLNDRAHYRATATLIAGSGSGSTRHGEALRSAQTRCTGRP